MKKFCLPLQHAALPLRGKGCKHVFSAPLFLFLSNSALVRKVVLLVKLLTYHITDICYLVLQAFDSSRKYSGFATPMKGSIKFC